VQFTLEDRACPGVPVAVRIEDAPDAAATLLCLLQGGMRRFQKGIGVPAVGRGDRRAQADAAGQGVRARAQRLRHGAQQPQRGRLDRVAPAGHVQPARHLQQHAELVPAKSAQPPPIGYQPAQPVGRGGQNLIARAMAIGAVQRGEPVQIQQDQRDRCRVRQLRGQRRPEALAVGQPRQRVAVRPAEQIHLRPPPGGRAAARPMLARQTCQRQPRQKTGQRRDQPDGHGRRQAHARVGAGRCLAMRMEGSLPEIVAPP
jgi:hypothetical protein